MDYTAGKIAAYDCAAQVWAQCKAVLVHPRSGPASGRSILYKIVDMIVGLRVVRRAGARRPRSSPITASAPTTCEQLPRSLRGAGPRCGWGGYPAPPFPSGGPGRKIGAPLLLGLSLVWARRVLSSPRPPLGCVGRGCGCGRFVSLPLRLASRDDAARRPMVNRALTCPPLWCLAENALRRARLPRET